MAWLAVQIQYYNMVPTEEEVIFSHKPRRHTISPFSSEHRQKHGQLPFSFEEWKQFSKPIRSDCEDSYDGWSSTWCDEPRVIDLTIELHSEFPYLDYYAEPLWVDMYDPEISKVVSKNEK